LTGVRRDATMTGVSSSPFTAALSAEFQRRRSINARFSLRAFARVLGMSHSAVSRLLRGRQRPSVTTLTRVAHKLGWSATRVDELMRREQIARLEAEARSPRFAADARAIASRANLSLDQVQLALHEALRTGRLEMTGPRTWKVFA
jgi:transcriptional regulator with XRE-family HTH domain